MNFDKPERNFCRSTWLPSEMCDYMYSRQYTNSDCMNSHELMPCTLPDKLTSHFKYHILIPHNRSTHHM